MQYFLMAGETDSVSFSNLKIIARKLIKFHLNEWKYKVYFDIFDFLFYYSQELVFAFRDMNKDLCIGQ